ncbi:type IV pilus biogenesis protein PilP [Paraburkholderia sp. NMBU_R16]|uniref:type IV pilus biogenesis protein PilP n=1 Tax=Paraburkholderia sp. NMBU_R16 TaxID=2698676 RepID=UPI00349F4EC2
MQLEEDTVILKAQLKKLDAQTQLAQRQQTLRELGDDASGSGLSIVATQSLGGAMSAVVSTSNGGEFDVHVGDVLPGALRVVSIHPGAVVIAEHGGHRSTLSVRASSKEPLRNFTLSGVPTGAIPPIPSVPMPPR